MLQRRIFRDRRPRPGLGQKDNSEELKKYGDRLAEAEAEEIEREIEISVILKARANYLTRTNGKVRISLLVWAISNGSNSLEKTPDLGSRIDIVLTNARISFFFNDNSLVTYFKYGQSWIVQS